MQHLMLLIALIAIAFAALAATLIQKLQSYQLDRIVSKATSAQFWMAIMTTVGATALCFYVAHKYPAGAGTVVTSYFGTWGIVMAFYFKRERSSSDDGPLPKTDPGTGTGKGA